jgi:hypothetical protein
MEICVVKLVGVLYYVKYLIINKISKMITDEFYLVIAHQIKNIMI